MRILTLFIALAFLTACQPSPGGGGEGNGGDEVSKEIGSDGGTISSKDGRLTLSVPAGALGNTETITITELAPDALGSEFDAVKSEIGVVQAYQLGPNGLTFAQPVTVNFASDQTLSDDGDLQLSAELLLSAQDGRVDVLDSIVLETDEAGKATLKGELSHFSPLAVSKLDGLVGFTIENAPNELNKGGSFDAVARVSIGFLQAEQAFYEDGSLAPVVVSSIGRLERVALTEIADGEYGGPFTYTCEAAGSGLFFVDLTVAFAEEQPRGFEGLASTDIRGRFLKRISCVGDLYTLTVNVEGEGVGTVTSGDGEIDCPPEPRCAAEYREGDTVELTAKPGGGSTFEGWSGDAAGGSTRVGITMDADKQVAARFGITRSGTLIPTGLFSLPIPFSALEAMVRLADPDFDDDDSRSPNVARSLAPQQACASAFGDLTGCFLTAFAGAEGFVVVDLLTGEVVLDETDLSVGPFFGIAGASQNPPGSGNKAMLLAFGANGYALNRFDKFGTLELDGATFDAFPAGGDPITDVAPFVQPNRGVGFYVYDDAQNLYVPAEVEFDDSQFAGELVSAYLHVSDTSDTVVPQPRGPVLVLTRAVESSLYLAKWDGSAPVPIAESLGLDARKIRCTGDGSGMSKLLCAVSVFGDDQLAILLWDGENLPTLQGFVDVGDGPVGIDLRALSNGNVAVVSTGFNDHTVTEAEVAADGSVVSSSTRAVLEDCVNPGHALYLRDSGSLKVVYTCYGSDNYGVEASRFAP